MDRDFVEIAIPWLALVVSAIALGFASWAAWHTRGYERRDNAIQARLVELEEARERDRVTAAARANVIASHFRDPGGGNFPHRLRIANTGNAEATGVKVRINSEPLETTEHVLRRGDPITLVAPGSHQDYTLNVKYMGPPPPYSIEVEWQDASGIAGESRAQFQV